LKPFLADEGSPNPPAQASLPSPAAPAAPSAAPTGEPSDWMAGNAVAPSGLGTPALNAPPVGSYGTPPPPARAGAGNLDLEGLPDWLHGAPPAQAPAPSPPAPSSFDPGGLPDWLQTGQSTAPPPASQGATEGLPDWLQ